MEAVTRDWVGAALRGRERGQCAELCPERAD